MARTRTVKPASAKPQPSKPQPAGSRPAAKFRHGVRVTVPRRPTTRCNGLDGKQWLRNSISVWSDIRKTAEENRLGHPAMFPGMLVERLIESFLRPDGQRILDPFCGSGSTIVTAERLGKTGIGLELSAGYVAMARQRLAETAGDSAPRSVIHHATVHDLLRLVEPESIDLCITSPPYWDILNQRRTADYKNIRHYGNLDGDLGTIRDYDSFLNTLQQTFADVLVALKPGAYCCVVVMDLRKKNRFFPLHSDLARRLSEIGFLFDDLIVWNRQAEYNNLRPLGYPAVFRINKVHEFVVLMQKPRA